MKSICQKLALLAAILMVTTACNTGNNPPPDEPAQQQQQESTLESSSQEMQEGEETESAPESLTADVVVVGSGLSGIAAATSAAQSGASVILLEKQGYVGGGIVASPGNLLICQVAENAEYHVYESDDTIELALARWRERMEAGGKDTGYPDYGRLETMLIRTMPAISWIGQMGVTFEQGLTIENNGMDTVRVDVPDIPDGMGGAKLVSRMQSVAEESGAVIMTNTPATALVVKDGRVTGVVAQSADGEEVRISATHVILACGGYGANEEMIAANLPQMERAGYFYQGVQANTGDGIRMAVEAGAAVYEEDWMVPSILTPSQTLLDINGDFGRLAGGFLYAMPALEALDSPADRILVNQSGNRVVNEAEGDMLQTMELLDSESEPYYVLYSNPGAELREILESGRTSGEVFRADSLVDLGEQAGMESGALEATVERYNRMAADGVDEDFGKAAEHLLAVESSDEYYLVRFVVSYVATMGGVQTNDDFQVLGVDGNPIEGLYAVGEMAHRFCYNRAYLSGASNNFALVMGRVAGEHAAANL